MPDYERKPSYPFRTDLDVHIWGELDRVSRKGAYTKRAMTEDGLRLWLERYYDESGDRPVRDASA